MRFMMIVVFLCVCLNLSAQERCPLWQETDKEIIFHRCREIQFAVDQVKLFILSGLVGKDFSSQKLCVLMLLDDIKDYLGCPLEENVVSTEKIE